MYLKCVVLLFFINYVRLNYLRLIYVTFDRNFYYLVLGRIIIVNIYDM